MSELRECPFCGGEVSIVMTGDERGLMWFFITRGEGENRCKCNVFMESEQFTDDYSPEDVEKIGQNLIDAWNTRYERACTIESSGYDELLDDWEYELSCGDTFFYSCEPPCYCPECGAKVVEQ